MKIPNPQNKNTKPSTFLPQNGALLNKSIAILIRGD
jgi:hypothetical protein